MSVCQAEVNANEFHVIQIIDVVTDVNNRFPSNWEMSVARASAIAGFLQANKIAPERMQVVGYGDSRPRFNADTAYKRALNRRVELLLLPEEQTR